jgi:hypothetical protein
VSDVTYYVRGFNPPVLIVKSHQEFRDAVWVVPKALPWACSRLVRRDQLTTSLRPGIREERSA